MQHHSGRILRTRSLSKYFIIILTQGLGDSGGWGLGFGFRVQGVGSRVSAFRVQGSGFGGFVFGIQGFRSKVQGLGFEVLGLQVARPFTPGATMQLKYHYHCLTCWARSNEVDGHLSYEDHRQCPTN